MTHQEFNELPWLMRRAQVLKCGLIAHDLAWLVQEGHLVCLQVHPTADFYYQRASIAPLVGLAMDWSRFDQWPALLGRQHLVECGLNEGDLKLLTDSGALRRLDGHSPSKWFKHELAELVGKKELVAD